MRLGHIKIVRIYKALVHHIKSSNPATAGFELWSLIKQQTETSIVQSTLCGFIPVVNQKHCVVVLLSKRRTCNQGLNLRNE